MQAFERRAGHQCARLWHAEQRRGFRDEEWPQPFAAAECRMAHRCNQTGWAYPLALDGSFVDELREQNFDGVCHGAEAGRKISFA